jgi:hypothetical protein
MYLALALMYTIFREVKLYGGSASVTFTSNIMSRILYVKFLFNYLI